MRPQNFRSWAGTTSLRVFTYFAIIITAIWVVNTPIPRSVIGALFGESVGIGIGQSLQRASRDLFLLLLISIYFEWAKGRQQHEIYSRLERRLDELLDQFAQQSPSNVRRTIIESADSHELASAALRRGLQIETPSDQLINLVAPNRPAFRDVSVAMTLESLPSSLIRIRSDVQLTATLRNILIGVTVNAVQGAILSNACPELLEVITVSSRKDMDQSVTAVNSMFSIYALIGNSTKRLAFERVREEEKRQLLGNLIAMQYDDVEIVRATNFPERQGQIRLQITYDFSCDNRHYCYWAADRPMHVSQIAIDARGLEVDESQVDLQLFLGAMRDVSYTRRQPMVFAVALDDWVLQGHGVSFVWW